MNGMCMIIKENASLQELTVKSKKIDYLMVNKACIFSLKLPIYEPICWCLYFRNLENMYSEQVILMENIMYHPRI